MIKYLKVLDSKSKYYLPLVDVRDDGKKEMHDYHIPISFFEKYGNVFNISELLIKTYKNFDIDKWFEEHSIIDYEYTCTILQKVSDLDERIYWVLEEYKKIDVKSRDIENYFNLAEYLSHLFEDLFPENLEYYKELNCILKQAKKELESFSTITYTPNKIDNIYLPDSWFITPNGYLYNPGKEGHKGCDFTFNYNEIKYAIMNNKNRFGLMDNEKNSVEFINIANDIIKKGYITQGQFKYYLNYSSQPAYLDLVDDIYVAREKHIVDMVVGIVMAHVYFYRFFEEFIGYVKNPKIELDKLIKLTADDLSDVLVRCCGFHKIESMKDKTITTSCINYEEIFKEYIEKGWNVYFVPPIIVNREKGCIEEYSEEALLIRKILKNNNCNSGYLNR